MLRFIRSAQPKRLKRERKTVSVMVSIYCRSQHHSSPARCAECRTMLDYALCRIDRCPFGAEKPTCANCPIHCYRPEMREKIQEIMRYAGPRMLLRHPVLAIHHLLDSRRPTPDL